MFKFYEENKAIIKVETTVSAIYRLIKIYNLDKGVAKTVINSAKKNGTAFITALEIRIDYVRPQTHDACPSHRLCGYCLHADLCPVWLDTGTTPLQISEYGEIVE